MQEDNIPKWAGAAVKISNDEYEQAKKDFQKLKERTKMTIWCLFDDANGSWNKFSRERRTIHFHWY